MAELPVLRKNSIPQNPSQPLDRLALAQPL
jgi:hypothetical protein